MKLVLGILLILCTASVMAADSNEDFLGYWVGTLRVMDNEIEIEIEIEFTEEVGEIKGTISVPVQMVREHPLIELEAKHPDIYFEFEAGGITAYFNGSMKKSYISGTFSQQGMSGLFHLVRGEKKEIMIKDNLPNETELSIETNYGSIFGSLVLPDKKDNIPVVIIVPGSGPTDRDGNNPMMGKGYIYYELARHLQDNGIASLRFDKRGIGESRRALRKEEDIRIDYYIQDLVLWINMLTEDNRFSKVIVLGHSEGALIGMVALQRVKADAFISVGGMGRNLADLLKEQLSELPEATKNEAFEIIDSIQKGNLVSKVKEELNVILRPEIQPYLASTFQYNPTKELAKLDIPILIMHGTTDLQVSEKDAQLLAASNAKADMIIIEGMNHVFREVGMDKHQNFKSYGDSEIPLMASFIDTVAGFVKKLSE